MDLETIYKKVFLIRSFENKLDELFKRGLIHGTAHLCIGQEFIPVIVSQHLTEKDIVTSTHRGHGHAISKGLEIKRFLAELMGKKEGYNAGRGGTQHVLSSEHNFFANGITGGMVPVANGLAFANKQKANKNIVVSFFGDGAMNEGYVLEALNLAAVLSLPVLFVCENNQYAMSTPAKYAHAAPINQKAKAFGIITEVIPDNDYKKLDDVAKRFVKDVREKCEPRFIEVQTYRFSGHSKNDKKVYRTREEEKSWLEKDVLPALEKEVIESNLMDQAKLDKIKDDIKKKIDRIAEEVKKMPETECEQACEGLVAE